MTQILMPKATAVWLIDKARRVPITPLKPMPLKAHLHRIRKSAKARAIRRFRAVKIDPMPLRGLFEITPKFQMRKFQSSSAQQNQLLKPFVSGHIGKYL